MAAELTTALRNQGWRVRSTNERRQAVVSFQRAYALTHPLKVDGVAGPRTMAALRLCERRRKAGLPTASAHFSFIEFRCKCGGRYSSCRRIWVTRGLILEMEQYRKAQGHGISVVSGNRCVGWNRHVGGATHSRHLHGDACDFRPERSVSWMRDRHLFSGLGWDRSSHHVRHGDMRPHQTQWMYS